ncbi:MAG: F0F1 ATP synthase subunit B [Acidimicrobiales bacterium]
MTGHVTLAASDFGLSFGFEWVALGIVVWLFVRYAVPFLRPRMNARIESIRLELAAGEQTRLEASELVAARAAALEEAKAEAAALVERAQQAAAHLVAAGRERAAGEYAYALARADVAIDLARARVREEVIAEVGALVVAVAERVVAAELDERGHHRLIAEAIAAAESERAS